MLALYIPFLSTDRLRRRDRASTGTPGSSPVNTERVPTATVLSHGQTIRIVHGDRAAYDAGVRGNQTLADAKAIVPELVTCQDDPSADRRQLEALALRANCLSPIVHIEGEDTLLVDVTGCERLFNGEPNLLYRAIEGFEAEGFGVRGGMADTPGAAWAIAHAHPEPAFIAEPGQTAAQLAPLPVWSLRIDAKTTAALSKVGVETIEALLYLPRSSLSSRFGDEPPRRIEQALGDVPEVLTPYRPEPVLRTRFEFGSTTTRIDVFQEAIRRALERFCKELSQRVAGVRQMFVTFYCPDVDSGPGSPTGMVTLEVSMSQPTRSVRHLCSLIGVLLDRLNLPAPADSLMLWAKHLDPLDDRQDELFAADSRDAAAFGDLLDRLAVRLGAEAVVRPVPLSDHQPERAFGYVPVVSGGCRVVEGNVAAGPLRPLRLLPRPIEVVATALVPQGPPISFRLRGRQHSVMEPIGPERIETGWWRGPHVQRDYYRVTTDTGLRCWLFRNRKTGKWFLHGWFD